MPWKNRLQLKRKHNVVNLMLYLQNQNFMTNHECYVDDMLLSSKIKEGFLKTATFLICLFCGNYSNKKELLYTLYFHAVQDI